MSILTEAIEQFEYWLWHHHPDVAESLTPGLTPEEIDSQAQHLSFPLSTEIYELYQWCDGSYPLFGTLHGDIGLGFMSLERAIEYSSYQEAGHISLSLNIPGFHMFPEYERWVHFAVCDGNETSPILLVTDDPYTRVPYASISSMILTTLECYEKEILILDKKHGKGDAVFNKSLIRELSDEEYERLDEYTKQFYVDLYVDARDEFKKILARNNSMFDVEAIRQKYNIKLIG